MRRALAAMVTAMVLWSIQDAIIWRGWFDGRPWSRNIDLYEFWHQALLVALIVVGVVALRGGYALWFAASTWTLSNSGLPDVLYYWMALKPIPQNLPWMDQTHPLVIGHPATAESVLISSALWLGFWLILLFALRYVPSIANRAVWLVRLFGAERGPSRRREDSALVG